MLGSAVARELQLLFPLIELVSLPRTNPLPAGVMPIDERILALGGFDIVIHAASPASPRSHSDSGSVFEANVLLTQRALESVRPGGVFIFLSSAEVYGRLGAKPALESGEIYPELFGVRSFYPLAKLVGESIALSRNDVRAVVFRVFHTFGPGLRKDDGRSFADILWGAIVEGQIGLLSEGSAMRSFLPLSDFISGVMHAVSNEAMQGLFNLGSPDAISILDFANEVAKISKVRVVRLSKMPASYVHSPIDYLVPDVSKLEAFGWNRKVNLGEAIHKTLSWIRLTGPSK